MSTITIKPCIYKHHRQVDGCYPIKLRVTFKGISRHLPTTYTATANQLTRSLKVKDATLQASLDDFTQRVRGSIAKISPFALDDMDVDDVVIFIKNDQKRDTMKIDFFTFAEEFIKSKSEGTRKVYRVALSSLKRYVGMDTLDVSLINKALLNGWVEHIKSEGKVVRRRGGDLKESSIAKSGASARVYLLQVATIFAAARKRYNDEDTGFYAIPQNPFAHIDIPSHIARGQKALPIEVIQKMIDDKDCKAGVRNALDLFLLSFALQGMNIADMYEVKKPKDGILTYYRKKVRGRRADGAEMTIRIEPCIAPLVHRLSTPAPGRWLFLADRWRNADTCTHATNSRLASWAEDNGLPKFTFYAARHSWATIARSAKVGADKALVDEALAHRGDLPLADIYAERDASLWYEVNKKVLALFDWSNL